MMEAMSGYFSEKCSMIASWIGTMRSSRTFLSSVSSAVMRSFSQNAKTSSNIS